MADRYVQPRNSQAGSSRGGLAPQVHLGGSSLVVMHFHLLPGMAGKPRSQSFKDRFLDGKKGRQPGRSPCPWGQLSKLPGSKEPLTQPGVKVHRLPHPVNLDAVNANTYYHRTSPA